MTKYVKNFKDVGECRIVINEVVKDWDDKWFLSQWDKDFTICNSIGLKVKINKKQAIELIIELDLMPEKSRIFKRARTWRKLTPDRVN